jgi:hypothetical protein
MSLVLNNFVLESVEPTWRKVARIIGYAHMDAKLKSMYENEQQTTMSEDDFLEAIALEIQQLVKEGKLESQGNLLEWRFSEIRIPSQE